ncbi:MAG: cation transporter [Streptosporangiaceae bacterium]
MKPLGRRPASGVWTFGFKRAEVLSAQANGITLLVISALIAFEAISRLIHPRPVTGGIVVTVAAVGVAVNVAAISSRPTGSASPCCSRGPAGGGSPAGPVPSLPRSRTGSWSSGHLGPSVLRTWAATVCGFMP